MITNDMAKYNNFRFIFLFIFPPTFYIIFIIVYNCYNSNSIKEQTFACTALLSKKTGSWHIVDMSAKKQGERIMSR